MIQYTKRSLNEFVQLSQELEWLCANHPDKKLLIALAEATIRTVEQASSTARTKFASMVLEQMRKVAEE